MIVVWAFRVQTNPAGFDIAIDDDRAIESMIDRVDIQEAFEPMRRFFH